MDRSRVLQLKTDLKHREDALRQQLAGARERPDNGAGGGSKLQGGVHRRQRERSEEWRDLKEEECEPDLYQASRAPQIQNPEGEEPIEKNRHRREEQDEQKRTNPRTARRGEKSRTSHRPRDKSQMPRLPIAGGGCR